MRIVKFHLVLMRSLSELRLSSRMMDITSANMAVTLAGFLSFLQNGEWIKIGKNHHKRGHTESCSSANRVSHFCQISLLRRHLRDDRMCRLKYIFSKSFTSAVV